MRTTNVTIIIPTYNGMGLLGPTLTALDEQQTGSFQVSVCDDASTDGSFELVASWAKSSRHEVLLTRNDANRGPSDSFGRAAASADSKYLIALAQDDILGPCHVANVIAIADQTPDIAAVMPINSQRSLLNSKKRDLRNWISGGESGWSTVTRLLGGNTFFGPGTLLRREYWSTALQHPANIQAQDFEMWLYLALHGRLVQSKEKVLYGNHDGNLHKCDPLDQDLDVGLTLRRFLGSSEFLNLRSRLGQDERLNLDASVQERLKVHLLTSPLTYFLATMDDPWKSADFLPPVGLDEALAKVHGTPASLLGWNRENRAQVLAKLRTWNTDQKKTPIKSVSNHKVTHIRRRAHLEFKHVLNERQASNLIRDLPAPWKLAEMY